MTTARPFDLVIFDLDGTLVDSAPDIAWALNAALNEASLPRLPLPTIIQLVGDGAAKLVDRALAEANGSNHAGEKILSRFLWFYDSHVNVLSRLFPGVVELLEALSRAGIATAVITNKPHELTQRLLLALGIANYFSVVIGDGNSFPRKPDPTAARSVIASVGTQSERTIVIGDGIPDVRMAHATPCPVIAAAWGYVPLAKLQAELPTFIAHAVPDAARILFPGDAPVTS
jgi:phosphoglycolate phosphatase